MYNSIKMSVWNCCANWLISLVDVSESLVNSKGGCCVKTVISLSLEGVNNLVNKCSIASTVLLSWVTRLNLFLVLGRLIRGLSKGLLVNVWLVE